VSDKIIILDCDSGSVDMVALVPFDVSPSRVILLDDATV
jgi:hypothetical protein